jgi:nucleoid-associated protein Lsr2
MAQRVQTILISDLSGDEVETGGESISFSYKGVDYTIDLTAKEAASFEKAIARYVEHARKAGRTRTGRSASSSGARSGARSGAPSDARHSHVERIGNMKRWAEEQGIDYPKRGRLPKSLIEAYDAAH